MIKTINSNCSCIVYAAVIAATFSSACTEQSGQQSQQQKDAYKHLQSLGYVSTTDEPAKLYPGPPVRVHDPQRAYNGLTYFTSGHAPEGFLMDMQGRILHRWHYLLPTLSIDWQKFWRRMYLYPNGDVLAVFEGKGGGIAKLDKDSNVLWAHNNNAHHDLEILPDGRIFVLTRVARSVPSIHTEMPVLDDTITCLNANGEMIQQWSILDALIGTPWEQDLVYRLEGDILHTNTIEVLDGRHQKRHPAFAKNNILLSFRHTNAIAIFDVKTAKIIWYEKGPWIGQHQPSFLPNGNILLFANNTHTKGPSRVIEYDPLMKKSVWTFDNGADKEFYSSYAGSVSALPNGNVLVSLSFNRRAVEITRDKKIVWDFRSPFVINKKLAQTPEYVRVPPDFPIEWAKYKDHPSVPK